MSNIEDEMHKPVTRLELREELSNYATKSDLNLAIDALVDRMDTRMDATDARMDAMERRLRADLADCARKSDLDDFVRRSDLPGIENRIAQAVVSALELQFTNAINVVLKDHIEPRFKRLEDKVFAPKRRGRS